MKNSKGFSLLELMLGLGLLTLIIAGMTAVLSSSKFSAKKLETDLGNDIENSIAERVILKDLRLSEPSFNNILTKDDANRGFFDYIVDSADKNALVNSGRVLTLDGTSPTKNSITFLSSNPTVGGAIIYDPTMAYDIGPEPSDFDKAATLNFISLNKNSYLQKQNPAYWVGGRILMLDTPVSVRKLTAGVPDYTIPSRSPVFVGVVSILQPTLIPITMDSALDISHPLFSAKTMTSEDIFLRNVPSVGGGAALVRLKAVNAIRYKLVMNSMNQMDLIRSTWINNTWGASQVISSKVKNVVMTRKAINDPLIYFKIIRVGDE